MVEVRMSACAGRLPGDRPRRIRFQRGPVRLPAPAVAVVGALELAPWILATTMGLHWWPRPSATPAGLDAPGRPAPSLPARPGPWGDLSFERIVIEPPLEYVSGEPDRLGPYAWFFRGYTAERLAELFRAAGLTESQQARLLQEGRWRREADGFWIEPETDLILKLAPQARARVYAELTLFPENLRFRFPFHYRREHLGGLFDDADLSPATLARFKSLLYPHGDSSLFVDLPALASTIEDPEERRRAVAAVFRQVTCVIQVRVAGGAAVDDLIRYWDAGVPARAADLKPVLESLNFARPVPDDRFADPAIVQQTLNSDYALVEGRARFGDVIALFGPAGEVLHTAVYLADDLVFTRNGSLHFQPYVVMRLAELVSYYSATYPLAGPLEMDVYRRKSAKD